MTIYLDNAATSYPKPERVYTRWAEFLREAGANPGRSGHRMALEAERELSEVRLKLARLSGAAEPRQIIFTLNGTDALNLAIKGTVRPGDHVITSHLEHNSVSRPLERLRVDGVISLTKVGFDAQGLIDPAEVKRAIRPETRLIVLTHASNVLGTVQPIAEVGALAREHDLLFLVDAAQSAGAIPLAVQTDQIDLLAAPGHKSLLGPPGTGFLYIGERAAAAIKPGREGGTGGDSTSRLQPEEFPFRLEAGTPNTAGIAALGAGLDYLQEHQVTRIQAHEVGLINQLREGLSELPGTLTYPGAATAPRAGVLSFNVAGFSAPELGMILDQSFNIAVRAGLHCAPFTHEGLGTLPDGTVRASVGPFTTSEDIAALVAALREITS